MNGAVSAMLAHAADRLTPKTLGGHLQKLRRAQGLSQRDVVALVAKRGFRFDHTYLSKIENDWEGCRPSRELIGHLAAVLSGDLDELLALAGKPPEDVAALLVGSEGARRFYRAAVEKRLSEDQWVELRRAMEAMR